MPGTNVAFIHASPAAIGPLANYYAQAEPGWTITNLLDDGIMRQFREGDEAAVESGLLSLVERACSRYRARAAMITCSAVRRELLGRLQTVSPVPLVKIDVPMAEAAVAAGTRIGVLVTFPPTVQTAASLLREAARSAGRHLEVRAELREAALKALLAGDADTHDRILGEAALTLKDAGVDAVVLAQVSMAHLRPALEARLGVPVFSSLETSHQALKRALGE